MRVCSVTSELLSSYEGHLRNLHEAWQGNIDASRGRGETEAPFLVATVIMGFLSVVKKSQSSSRFEALNSACLSRCQRDVRSPVPIRRGPRAFSRVSTGRDLSSCEMKDEPAFKPLHGNTAFFLVSAFRFPFHLREQSKDPSHIPIVDRSLL